MSEEITSEVKEIENFAMAEENTLKVKEIENCSDTNPPEMMSEEGSVETVLVKDVGNMEDVTSVASKTNEVPKPPSVTPRRNSTGAIGTRAGKLQVQSRYRGNHHVSSTHDLCKHGMRCDRVDVVKPWKMVRRKSVEDSEAVKSETSSSSLGSLSRQIPATKPESSAAVKRDALAVKKKPSASVNSETSSLSEMARSVDGSSVKSNDKPRKNRGTEDTLSGSAVVKKVPGLGNEKSKVSRISEAESSKVSTPKNLKNKEKATAQTTSIEDVKEKTVCVVEASVKGVQSEKQASSDKTTMSSGHKILSTPTKVPGKVSTVLTNKKESVDADLVANQKPEKKIRPKKTSLKVTQAKPLSFKKGKTLEPKPDDASPKWIKFRKRVMQELKPQTEGRKRNLKSVETKKDSCEGSKREKVVLRHRKVEGKKKMMTLFNSVIEETMNKLTKVKKTKVKALIGAFETVISLQDTKTPQRVQSKATTSASKVSPLGSEHNINKNLFLCI